MIHRTNSDLARERMDYSDRQGRLSSADSQKTWHAHSGVSTVITSAGLQPIDQRFEEVLAEIERLGVGRDEVLSVSFGIGEFSTVTCTVSFDVMRRVFRGVKVTVSGEQVSHWPHGDMAFFAYRAGPSHTEEVL